MEWTVRVQLGVQGSRRLALHRGIADAPLRVDNPVGIGALRDWAPTVGAGVLLPDPSRDPVRPFARIEAVKLTQAQTKRLGDL